MPTLTSLQSTLSRTTAWLATGTLLVLCWTWSTAAGATVDTEPIFDTPIIESFTMSSFDRDGIELALSLSTVARATATLDYLIVDDLAINDVRFTVPVIPGPLRLQDGQPIAGLSDVRARISFRQMASLDPIRALIADGKARVRGRLRGWVGFTFFQRLFAMSSGAWVVTSLDRDVDVRLPGDEAWRRAAVSGLGLVEPIWAAGRALQTQSDATAVAGAEATLGPSLVHVETSYDLRSRDGRTSRHVHGAVGTVISAGAVLAPAEAATPWLFDEATAEALSRGETRVVDSSVTFTVSAPSRGGGGRPGAPTQATIHALRVVGGADTAVSPRTRRRYRLRVRADDRNLAVLVVRDAGTPAPLAELASADDWQPAVVVSTSVQSGSPQVAYRRTAVRRRGPRLELQDGVGDAFYGSPIWTNAGVVGMVQDSTSGVALAALASQVDEVRARVRATTDQIGRRQEL